MEALSIIIADDNDLLRHVIKACLETLRGVNILTATNGIEALNFMENMGEETCLLITDHEMPGMTGDELIRKAKERFPKIKSILISGRLSQREVDGLEEPFKPTFFLAKPFSAPAMVALVVKLLGDYMLGE